MGMAKSASKRLRHKQEMDQVNSIALWVGGIIAAVILIAMAISFLIK